MGNHTCGFKSRLRDLPPYGEMATALVSKASVLIKLASSNLAMETMYL